MFFCVVGKHVDVVSIGGWVWVWGRGVRGYGYGEEGS